VPTKVVGSNVMHKKDGKWTVKQHCSSHTAALSAQRAINMAKHGIKLTGKKRGR
jgi:hypothetical protein